jgi:MFS family permease
LATQEGETEQASEAAAHDAYAALRFGGFRRYLVGNFISVLGTQMQTVAVGWEVYEKTGSALNLGYVGLAQFLPLVLLALPAGHVADNFNRKHIVMAAQGLMAACSLAIALNSARGGPVWVVYACLLANGVARAFQGPAKSSLMPLVVPRPAFSNAVSWNSGAFELASMSGPAAGGALIAIFKGAVWVYLGNAVAAFAFFFLLAGVRAERQAVEREPLTLGSLVAGFRFVRRTEVVLGAMTLDMFAVLLGGATMLLPVYAKDILHVGPGGLGWLRAAPAVGAFTTAMLLAHRPPIRKAGRALLLAVAGFGAATIVFGLSTNFWLSLVMLLLTGVFDSVSVVIRHTLVQVLTPDVMRGRVSAINGLFIGTSNELGGFESGLVAGFFGPVVSVVAGGVGTLVVVLTVALVWPKLRKYGALTG